MDDLSDVTFMLPVSIDFPERMLNLELQIKYLRKHLKTNIFVYESDTEPKVEKMMDPEVFSQIDKYDFFEFHEGAHFHRTKLLNQMALASETPIIVNQDLDIFVNPHSYKKARDLIAIKKKDNVKPFNMDVHMISNKLREEFIVDLDWNVFAKTKKSCGGHGGSIFFKKDAFFKVGMENEYIIAWGPDDCERHARWSKLGFKMDKVAGYCCHLPHPRTQNSSSSGKNYSRNCQEYKKTLKSSRAALKKYIATWPWCKDKTLIETNINMIKSKEIEKRPRQKFIKETVISKDIDEPKKNLPTKKLLKEHSMEVKKNSIPPTNVMLRQMIRGYIK